MKREEWIDAWLADELSADEKTYFEESVEDDPELRVLFVEQASIHGILAVKMGPSGADETVIATVINTLQNPAPEPLISESTYPSAGSGKKPNRSKAAIIILVAILLLLAIGIGIALFVWQR